MAERKQKRATRLKYIARTAAAIIIVFALLSAHPTVATAMKKIFSQTVVQWFDKYISIETQADTYPQQITDFTVGYMTDGFVLKEEYKITPEIIKVYYNDDDFIKINIRPDDNNGTVFIDNEYSTFNSIYINGIEGTVATHPTGYNRLIISVNGIQYNISGFVESDEIIKIYENIKISL